MNHAPNNHNSLHFAASNGHSPGFLSAMFCLPRKLTRVTLLIGLLIIGLIMCGWIQVQLIQIQLWTGRKGGASEQVNHQRLKLKKWWLRMLCKVLGVKIHCRGGPWTNPVLMVCNHISWLDIPVLGAGASFHFLAKSEIRKWPVIGWLSRVTGTLFIHRRSRNSDKVNRELARYLGIGNSVLVFPEGSTTDGYQVDRFHSRLLQSAINSHVAIQPITLAYSTAGRPNSQVPFIRDDRLVPHVWKLLGEKVIHVHLHYHPPVTVMDQSAEQLAQQTHSIVEKGLKRIFPLFFSREVHFSSPLNHKKVTKKNTLPTEQAPH